MSNSKNRRSRRSERPGAIDAPESRAPRRESGKSGEHESAGFRAAARAAPPAPPLVPDAQTDLMLRLAQGINKIDQLAEKIDKLDAIEERLDQLDPRSPVADARREPESKRPPAPVVDMARERRSRSKRPASQMTPAELYGSEDAAVTKQVQIDIYPAHKRFINRAAAHLHWGQAEFFRRSALAQARQILKEEPPETPPYQTGPKDKWR
jgi:hypothetical protein